MPHLSLRTSLVRDSYSRVILSAPPPSPLPSPPQGESHGNILIAGKTKFYNDEEAEINPTVRDSFSP